MFTVRVSAATDLSANTATFGAFESNLLTDIGYALQIDPARLALDLYSVRPGVNGGFYIYFVVRLYPADGAKALLVSDATAALTAQSQASTSMLASGAAGSMIDPGYGVQQDDTAPVDATPAPDSGSSSIVNTTTIIIVIVVLVVVLIAVAAAVYVIRRKRAASAMNHSYATKEQIRI
jgi:hypothetical protein